ncbi:CDP-glucose 4,6-dehydratase [Methanolacinia petrolearia DSM 11571]|uniref:CDP-glucose 4,6-dehydratase n=1 Tax=Methanolacinia petrolearia (strain DSM 11571 / OCM 486 / SEBR 4847) TaxID=679926 RepID=E1REV8_METP4|nr:CDP-glucose 4,6-dehydratase [Methanolacinia petrolearia]ADN36129.1 CDP-glucose 4,6-dehydratase [Methanolacinia petrolearia DSM 11571]
MSSLSVFAGKKVFVTGHTGFKGSWLSIWLSKLEAEVYGYSLPPPTSPNNYSESGVAGLLEGETIGDIRNADILEESIRSADPDVIFHLAAQPIVRYSYDNPAETFEANVMGSVYLLDAVRKIGRPVSVIMVTSDKCYENTGQIWGYRENDMMGGHDPYSASKGAAEIAISSYRRSFFAPSELDRHGIGIASVRAGNVIGGGDWAEDRIIPDAVRALKEGKPLQLRNPGAVRPWQHVLESLSGYLTLAGKMMATNDPSLCSAWNFGPYTHDACTVAELVEKFYSGWGEGSVIDSGAYDGKQEARFLKLSIEKAIYQLRWHPGWSLDDAIRKTAYWYRNYKPLDHENNLNLCHEDIDSFMKNL